MKQRAIKMPDDLWEQVKDHAAKLGLTAGEFVRLAVEEKVGVEPLHGPEQIKQLQQAIVTSRGDRAKVIEATTAVTAPRRVYGCPVFGCPSTALSPRAHCRVHGRTVVPL